MRIGICHTREVTTASIVNSFCYAFPIQALSQWVSLDVDRQVDDDSVQPSVEARLAAESVNAEIGSKQRFLRDFLCIVFVAHECNCELPNTTLVASHEHVERRSFASLDTRNELIIGQAAAMGDAFGVSVGLLARRTV